MKKEFCVSTVNTDGYSFDNTKLNEEIVSARFPCLLNHRLTDLNIRPELLGGPRYNEEASHRVPSCDPRSVE